MIVLIIDCKVEILLDNRDIVEKPRYGSSVSTDGSIVE